MSPAVALAEAMTFTVEKMFGELEARLVGRDCRHVGIANLLSVRRFFAQLPFFVLCGATACASAKLNVTSEPPEAEVYVRSSGANESKLVGKTPLNLEGDTANALVDKGAIVFEVRKPGFVSSQVYLPNLSAGDFSFKLFLKPEKSSGKSGETNTIVKLILESERAILEKRYDEANRLAVKIREIDPNIAASYTIEATVFYIQGKFAESKAGWLRTLDLDPDDAAAQKMIADIDGKTGKTAPEKKSP